MRKKIILYAERAYPYLVAVVICVVLYKSGIDFSQNPKLDNLIDGIVTMESIVIGLMGAMIPVVLSMKNDSKFVTYVFENDTHHLFKKYLTVTIGEGILSLIVTLSMYMREEYEEAILKNVYNAWLYLVLLFLFLTYRSMKYMIEIIFTPDLENNEEDVEKLDEQISKNLREKHSKKLE